MSRIKTPRPFFFAYQLSWSKGINLLNPQVFASLDSLFGRDSSSFSPIIWIPTNTNPKKFNMADLQCPFLLIHRLWGPTEPSISLCTKPDSCVWPILDFTTEFFITQSGFYFCFFFLVFFFFSSGLWESGTLWISVIANAMMKTSHRSQDRTISRQ